MSIQSECLDFKMNHALLIVGGTGKERSDYAFSIAVEYLEKKKVEELLNHPDFFLIEEENSIGIDEIRSLQTRISYKPYLAKFKVVLIKEAHKMTTEAENALLKTLEEPPDQTFISILSPSKGLLLETIISRCEILELPTKDEIEIPDEDFEEEIIKCLEIFTTPIKLRFKMAETMTDREDAIIWLRVQMVLYRQIFLMYLNCTNIVNKKFPQKNYEKVRPFLTTDVFLTIFSDIKKTLLYLEHNTNVRLTMEVYFLDFPLIQPQKSSETA